MKILIASGVNLDLLGTREPEIYGSETLTDMETLVKANVPYLKKAFSLANLELRFFQTNDEASLLSEISKRCAGIVLNPGAWTHTSLALADRLKALNLIYVEVHVSQLTTRESFRQHSYSAVGASGVVQGFGIYSYLLGLQGLLARLAR